MVKRLVLIVCILFLVKSGHAQNGAWQLMAGYNFGLRPLDYEGYRWQHHFRLNVSFYFNKNKNTPYIHIDLLGSKFKNTSARILRGVGYTDWYRNNYQQAELVGEFGLGLRLIQIKNKYINVSAGFMGFGRRRIRGCQTSRVTKSFTDSTGKSRIGIEYKEECLSSKIVSLPENYFKPFAKVEYGFQSRFTSKHNLEYKLGLSTWNLYFLVGLSRVKQK